METAAVFWHNLRMFAKLLALFIGIPLVEILIMIKMGDMIGFWPTVMIVIGTGFAGALLARIAGYRIWLEIQAELEAGRIPADKLIDALILFAAGIFLITPGLLTDITGLLLLLPGPRNLLKRWLRRKFESMMSPSRPGGNKSFTWIPDERE